jgi:AGZA family xanthine/uracil permease-like MFS transporter
LVALISFLGLVGLLLAVFPIQALVPILLYIGLVIGAQAFQTTPRVQAAGVVLALIPNIANWAQGQIDNVLQAAGGLVAGGSGTGHVELSDLIANGVVYDGLVKAGGGAVLAGLVLGAIAVFVIEREFMKAAIYSGAGAVLALFGFINSGSLACTDNGCDFSSTFAVFVAYLIFTGVCLFFALVSPAPRGEEELAAIAEMESGSLTA